MKEFQVRLNKKEIIIIQDDDGKFITPDFIKEQNYYGTTLKPAYEPIIVARKPFKGSLVDNVIENGVGGLNIDECRVGNEHFEIKNGDYDNNPNQSCFGNVKQTPKEYDGRFPANVILTYDETDFDEVCGGMPYTKSNGGKTSMPDLRDVGKKSKETIGIDKLSFGQVSNAKRKESDYIAPSDSGSASRYFYCTKASKKDRDEGIPDKWLDNLELILYNNIGEEIWKDKISIKEANKVKHLEDMEISLKKVIEEYGIKMKKDIDLNILLYGKIYLEKYLKENKSTIKTRINSTTIYQILNLLNLYITKGNTQVANLEMEYGGNRVEIVENLNQLQIIIKENQELVHGVENVVLKMLLKINEKDGHNEHCTVKPTELMRYLVRLVSPKGATILDPFMGSGSTGKAVMYENKERNANYKFVGIELTEEYLPIAKNRIDFVNKDIIDISDKWSELD